MSTEPKKDEGANPPKPMTDSDLILENERLKAEIKMRTDQVRTVLTALEKRQQADTARESVEVEKLIDEIILDSSGKWKKEELKTKTKEQLNAIREDQARTLERTFASIAAMQADADRQKKPQLTLGYWDSAKKQWTGGI